MKYRIFSVLVILAMVASLCVIAAVPASAQVSNLTVDASTYDANKTAKYELTFDAESAIDTDDTIAVEFDSAFDVPETIDPEYVQVNNVESDDVSVDGTTVNVYPGSPVAAGAVEVDIRASAEIGNPELADDYEISVSVTNQDSVSTDVTIVAWAEADKYQLPSGDAATVEGAGFKDGYTAYCSGALQGQGSVESDGTIEFTAYFKGYTGDAWVEDGSGRSALVGSFTLLPTIEVSPESGNGGTEVTIEGYNFMGPTPGTPNCPEGAASSGTWAIQPGDLKLAGETLINAGSWTANYDEWVTDLDQDGVCDDFEVKVTIPSTQPSGAQMIAIEDTHPNSGTDTVATGEFSVNPRVLGISPGSGAPGSSVTIEGSGFDPDYAKDTGTMGGQAILMYGNTGNYEIITENIEVDDEGNFIAVGEIPDGATDGMQGVLVFFDPNDNEYSGTEADELAVQTVFVVTERQLSIVPESGPFGPEVTLSGGDFGEVPDGAVANLYVNGESVGTIELSTSGDVVPESLEVKRDNNFETGNNEVKATYDGRTAIGVYTVERPTIDLDKSEGPRGTKVTVEGAGWDTSSMGYVTIEVDDGDGFDAVEMVEPDGDGGIWAQITVSPDAEPGKAMQVRATQGDNESLKETFMVTDPEIKVDPESAAVGEEIAITGTGFGTQQPIQSVKLGGVNVVSGGDLPITDKQGGFEVTATVPGLAPGGKALAVEDAKDNTYTVPFTITSEGETGDISVEDGLATIDGLYTIVWTFDSEAQEWQVYDVAEGAPDDFTRLNKGQGYWIQVTEDCTLNYGSATYNLNEGWNLIGWLG